MTKILRRYHLKINNSITHYLHMYFKGVLPFIMKTTKTISDKDRFHGSVFALTGAASGIGRALAFELASAGCHLALCDKDPANLNAVRLEVVEEFPYCDITTHVLDVSDEHDVELWAHDCKAHFGEINGLINNAGVSLSASVESVDLKDFHWLMNINFWGVVHCTKAFLTLIKSASWGHIVNVSSLFGLIGTPNSAAYNASKFAVRGFSDSLSMELQISAPHVCVTCVHPGGVKTSIVDNGREGSQRVGSAASMTLEQRRARFNDKLARTSAQEAAATIMQAIIRKRTRILVGTDAKLLDKLQRYAPSKYQTLIVRLLG